MATYPYVSNLSSRSRSSKTIIYNLKGSAFYFLLAFLLSPTLEQQVGFSMWHIKDSTREFHILDACFSTLSLVAHLCIDTHFLLIASRVATPSLPISHQ
jgi:hypothetical protein